MTTFQKGLGARVNCSILFFWYIGGPVRPIAERSPPFKYHIYFSYYTIIDEFSFFKCKVIDTAVKEIILNKISFSSKNLAEVIHMGEIKVCSDSGM